MLNFIYSKLLLVLELTNRNSHRLERIEQRLGRIETALEDQAAILKEIRELLSPEPAVTLELTAGPVEEQPPQ